MTKNELIALPYAEYLKSSHWLAVRRMMLLAFCPILRFNICLEKHGH